MQPWARLWPGLRGHVAAPLMLLKGLGKGRDPQGSSYSRRPRPCPQRRQCRCSPTRALWHLPWQPGRGGGGVSGRLCPAHRGAGAGPQPLCACAAATCGWTARSRGTRPVVCRSPLRWCLSWKAWSWEQMERQELTPPTRAGGGGVQGSGPREKERVAGCPLCTFSMPGPREQVPAHDSGPSARGSRGQGCWRPRQGLVGVTV